MYILKGENNGMWNKEIKIRNLTKTSHLFVDRIIRPEDGLVLKYNLIEIYSLCGQILEKDYYKYPENGKDIDCKLCLQKSIKNR